MDQTKTRRTLKPYARNISGASPINTDGHRVFDGRITPNPPRATDTVEFPHHTGVERLYERIMDISVVKRQSLHN